MDETRYTQQMQRFLADTLAGRPELGQTFYRWPILNEDTPSTGFDTHYVYHVAWALHKLKQLSPAEHVDFSSSLHFCTAASAMCPTTFYDLRPAPLHVPGLSCRSCDLTLPDLNVGQHRSVSCMHVVEHIGLGRYGDQLDAHGDLKAMANLKKVVAPGGDLLFVVPAGQPSISFNAHRVYSVASILGYFEDSFTLAELYFIPGPADLPPQLNPDIDSTLAYPYGCACFHFRKR